MKVDCEVVNIAFAAAALKVNTLENVVTLRYIFRFRSHDEARMTAVSRKQQSDNVIFGLNTFTKLWFRFFFSDENSNRS